MTNKVQKIREEVARLKSQLLRGACSSQIAMETRCKEEAYDEVLTLLDSMQEDPESKYLVGLQSNDLQWRTDKPSGSIIVAKLLKSFTYNDNSYEVLYYNDTRYSCYYDAGGEEIPYTAIEKWFLIEQ